jgi:hypothetical protein
MLQDSFHTARSLLTRFILKDIITERMQVVQEYPRREAIPDNTILRRTLNKEDSKLSHLTTWDMCLNNDLLRRFPASTLFAITSSVRSSTISA